MLDRSFNEIANAIIDSITALPPKPPPLTDGLNGRNPDCTSAAYIINKAKETKRSMIEILVFITNLSRVFLINLFYLILHYLRKQSINDNQLKYYPIPIHRRLKSGIPLRDI
jgi:hypothetical protein